MKILISIGSLGLGGAEKQAVWLANEFSVEHQVTLITFHGGIRESELSDRVRWKRLVSTEKSNASKIFLKNLLTHKSTESLDVEKNKLRKQFRIIKKSFHRKIDRLANGFLIFRNFLQIYQDISATKPEFVITFLFHDTLFVGLATLLRRKPSKLIVGRRSPFGYSEANRGLLEKSLMRFVYSKADYAVTNSSANISNAIVDGIAVRKICLIENFVENDSNIFERANYDVLTLVCIANFYDYKNHFNLIEAIARFDGRVQVTFLGDGPLKKKAIELAQNLKVESKFYGHEDQRNFNKHEMDFFVLPSKFEGSSNALLEALIEGFPAITTPVGIAKELCNIDAPLIVTNGFSVDDFEEAINTAFSEKDKYIQKAIEFKGRITEAHSKMTIFGKWSDLLNNSQASLNGRQRL